MVRRIVRMEKEWNLSKRGREALNSFRRNNTIVIKPADKSSVPIRGAMRQLQDFYRPLDKPISEIHRNYREAGAVCEGSIHQGQGDFTYYQKYTRIQHVGSCRPNTGGTWMMCGGSGRTQRRSLGYFKYLKSAPTKK